MSNLKNVEIMEQTVQQQAHEKSWFNRFKTKALVGSSALVVGSAAMAAEGDPVIPDFLAPAKTFMTGIGTDLGTVFMVAIGITLVVIAFTVSRGGISRVK